MLCVYHCFLVFDEGKYHHAMPHQCWMKSGFGSALRETYLHSRVESLEADIAYGSHMWLPLVKRRNLFYSFCFGYNSGKGWNCVVSEKFTTMNRPQLYETTTIVKSSPQHREMFSLQRSFLFNYACRRGLCRKSWIVFSVGKAAQWHGWHKCRTMHKWATHFAIRNTNSRKVCAAADSRPPSPYSHEAQRREISLWVNSIPSSAPTVARLCEWEKEFSHSKTTSKANIQMYILNVSFCRQRAARSLSPPSRWCLHENLLPKN